MDEFVTPKEAKRVLGVSNSTLRLWDKQGKIDTIRAPSGRRLYNIESIQTNSKKYENPKEKQKICYCRVSSKKQMDDLERQKNFFRTKYPDYKLVTDIGSGLNWKRKGLQTILEQSMSGNVEEIMVAHRDRLSRFAFELIKFILERNGTTLTVLDSDKDKSEQRELAEDLMSIIHVFSCREMGKRRYSIENAKDKNLPEQRTGVSN